MTVGKPSHADGAAAIALRPIVADDHSFLLAVYASTRELELAAVPWDAGQKAAFVRMQFDAQHAHYQEHYAGATFDVILVFGQPAGRLYVSREGDEIRIVDIALLRECCNRGVGTTLLRELQSEAAAAGKPLCIHVERFNPALRLYERLGFTPIADRGVYVFMEWAGSKTLSTPNSQLQLPKRTHSNPLGETETTKQVEATFTQLSRTYRLGSWRLEVGS